ncbi:uncharacterized protein LOC124896287 [Capsicum annuum]|uniref:uncharacterized protein LOC124896287 n=1 Tax=Capsicum annuum TaxID=4072 RepID=UPI001FB11592|nr:uncharacterized protein LOC124896287 [Capsicum annuum]
MEQIKSYIKTYHEDEYTRSVIHITNDEPSVLEPLKTEIQDCVHIHTECPTIAEVQFDQKDEHMNDQEEEHKEESKNTHIIEMEDISIYFCLSCWFVLDAYQYFKSLYL